MVWLKELPLYQKCFVCGDANPAGLRVRFYADGEEVRAGFVPDERWEGYPGMVHGGVLAALLDEVMYKAVFAQGEFTVTAKIEVRFRSPARVGVPLEARGRAGDRKGRLIKAQGEIRDGENRLIATAAGTFCVLPPAQQKDLPGTPGASPFETLT
ncbi:MAG: PaaI family thioesterase [Bacillota bacterium]|jgi:uncharacterized protein (TIGR00369 family)|nr:PaaI family thioesterase [Bacillota bacterium]